MAYLCSILRQWISTHCLWLEKYTLSQRFRDTTLPYQFIRVEYSFPIHVRIPYCLLQSIQVRLCSKGRDGFSLSTGRLSNLTMCHSDETSFFHSRLYPVHSYCQCRLDLYERLHRKEHRSGNGINPAY